MRTFAVLLAICAAGLFDPQTAAAQSSGNILSIGFEAANNGDGTWTVSGWVDSDYIDPTGLTVWFGGLLQGYQTVVQPDGSFERTVSLPPYARGMLLAAVEDPYGDYAYSVFFLLGN